MQEQSSDELAAGPKGPAAVYDPESALFLDRLGARINATQERALEVTGVVLCTVLWEAPPEALVTLREALPPEVANLLNHCRAIRANTLALTSPTNIVTAIARRMNIDYQEAERFTEGVVEITREFVGQSNTQEIEERSGLA